MEETKIVYLKEGDMVTVKQDLPNKPIMAIERVVRTKVEGVSSLIGLRCYWFDKNGSICKNVFSTKDLRLIAKHELTLQ